MAFNKSFTPVDASGIRLNVSSVVSVEVYSTGSTDPGDLITDTWSATGSIIVVEFPDDTDEEVDIYVNGVLVAENEPVSDAGIFATKTPLT